MNEKITITKADGGSVAGELICAIENTATRKKYVYYTLNEIVGASVNSTVKIYVTKIAQNDPALDAPISEEDWKMLRDCMGDSIKGNTNPNIKYLPLSELGNITSVSERAIAMPTSYDYINKQRGIYATAIASGNSDQAPSSQAIEPTVAPIPETIVTPSNDEPAPVAMEPANLGASPEPQPFAPGMSNPQAPTIEPAPTPVIPEPTPSIEPVQPEPPIQEAVNTPGAELKPIDIAEIENKYKNMIESLENLKNNEIEAAKRYNATLELSEMHKEQHANYVQNEQTKETTEPSLSAPTIEPAAAPLVGSIPTLEGTPGAIEPTPVTPVEPVAPTNIETNWFDMPSNTAA